MKRRSEILEKEKTVEAKDTVMSDEKILEVATFGFKAEYASENQRIIARVQAEITWQIAFKAGRKSALEAVRNWIIAYSTIHLGKDSSTLTFDLAKWQAFLKERGIEMPEEAK